MEVDFDLPLGPVPLDKLHQLVAASRKAIGQQAPLDRLDALGRIPPRLQALWDLCVMECLGRGDLRRDQARHRKSAFRRHALHAQRLLHRASLLPRTGRYDELNLAHGPGPSDLLPKPVAAL